jgi:hypothetical protein
MGFTRTMIPPAGTPCFALVSVTPTSLSKPMCLPHTGVNTSRRGKVSTDPGVHEPTLSDVCCYRTSNVIPVQLPNGDTIWRLPNGDTIQIGGDPYGGRHSFIMHANCYSLLAQFLHPQPIPVTRLLEACRSCVVLLSSMRHLSWGPGHDYGGIIRLRNGYPWDETDDYEGQGTGYDPRSEDRWSIPEIIAHLQSSRLDNKSATQSKGKGSRQAGQSIRKRPKRRSAKLTTVGNRNMVSNYFTKFPLEILELILANTPTDEVKSLARTSKGLNMIIPSRLGQSFWASRFHDPFEYGFVFEAQTYRVGLDWKALYFSITKDPFLGLQLQNRRRIWGLIKPLSELICLEWKGGQGLLTLSSDENEWKEVHGLIQQPERDQNRSKFGIQLGCLRLYSQYTSIPALLCRIVVSTVSIGTATYITGLCFISRALISNQETKIFLGYTSKRELSLETTGLQGFIIAV